MGIGGELRGRGFVPLKAAMPFAGTVCALAFCIIQAHAQQGATIPLGRLSTGATVNFVKTASGKWGIDVAGNPHISQPEPARFEVYTGSLPGPGSKDDVHDVTAGYDMVQMSDGVVTAKADIPFGAASPFMWRIAGACKARRSRFIGASKWRATRREASTRR